MPVQASQVFTTTGTMVWTWPIGVTSVFAEAMGGGGSGGTASGNPATGGGGRGGTYAAATITKGADSQLDLVVGVLGGGTLAISSVTQSGTVRVRASSGMNGAFGTAASTNGAGATTDWDTSIGTTVFAGGNGGTGNFTSGVQGSGAGGGAAGPTGAGGNASVNTAGIAGPGTFANGLAYQVAGVAGVGNSTAGLHGVAYGGAASGGKANTNSDRAGGNGGQGIIVLTYTAPDQSVSGATIASTQTISGSNVALAANVISVGNYGTGNPGFNGAQSFNLGAIPAPVVCTSIRFYLAKTGSPTDNVYVEVREATLNGPLLATSNQVAMSGLPVYPTWGWTEFLFPTLTMQPSTLYFFRIMETRAVSSGSNYLQASTSGNTYAGGDGYLNDGTAFGSGGDYTFLLYGQDSSHTITAAGPDQAVTGVILASSAVVRVPTVAPGAVTEVGATIPSGVMVRVPTVVPGPVVVDGATCEISAAIFAPSLSTLAVERNDTFVWLM